VQNRCRSESIQRYAAYSRLNYPIFGVFWLCVTDKVFTETFGPTPLLRPLSAPSARENATLSVGFDALPGVQTVVD
jgi:hypothetical protein